MSFWSDCRQKRRVEQEVAREMAAHLAEKIEQLREEGYSEGEARSCALRQFGNVTLYQEDSRAAWGWNFTEQVWQDLHFGWRVLRKTPGFTAIAVAVLALGIGMNTAMFSAVKAVLLSALPYPEPERMVELRQTAKDGHLMNVSYLDFQDWRKQSRTVERMAEYGDDAVTISGNFTARRVRMATVGNEFFEVVATRAAVGRTFAAADQRPGGAPTLVLGYDLAVALFGMPGRAVQQSLQLNGLSFTVIGVMPPKFNYPDGAQLWLPNDLFPDDTTRSAHNYQVVGRLKPGITVAQAQADMNVVAARLAREYIDDRDEGIRLISLFEFLTSGVRPALLVLLGAVGMVLLIACVNISNLQMARGSARKKELGMRFALGAARTRLLRQLLTENILLAGGGGLLGLGIAELAVRLLRIFAPSNIPRLENLSIDDGVLCFTAGLSLFAGVLFGILPSLESSRADVNAALKQATGKGEGVSLKRRSQLLVIGQITLAIVLLSGSALLIKSYWKLEHVQTGLSAGGVYVADLTWPASADGNSVDGGYVVRAGTQILQQIRNLPGVQAVAFVHGLPFQGAPDGSFEIEGRPLPADPHLYPDADYRMVTAEYFKALGIPVLQGRGFTLEDQSSGQQVATVNQSFEKQFFPAGGCLGKRIRFLGFDRKPKFMTVVGIVPDVRASALNQAVRPEVYANYFQHADGAMDAALVVRGPASLQAQIKTIVTALNRSTAVDFEDMEQVISGTITRERFQTWLLGVFAACALMLAVIGVYGVLSYSVTRRTSEIGVRLALGASRGTIAGLVLRQGGNLILSGTVLGLVGSLVATRVLESMLYEVKTSDASVLLAVVIGFMAVALIASYLPAQRASRIEPVEALRRE